MSAVRPRIVCLAGPTASGKTELALWLAERIDAEIVSADSRQIYRFLDVGTAKPSAEERARVAHHGLDLVDPGELFDAARYRTSALAAIADIHARGRAVLVVGGTGLYLRALVRGLCPAPPRVPALRSVLDRSRAARGGPALHAGLTTVDPEAAARIDPHDGVRVVRALEVALASGVPLSRWQAAHRFAEQPFEAMLIGLARPVEELAARIEARARAMIAAGFLDEVRALAARGFAADAPGLTAVGYRELRAHLEGRGGLADALAATVQATCRFAKRQRTWFRREPGLVWRHPEHDRLALAREVEEFLAGARAAALA
jgi:tRNA dimethylallyltransferase